MAEQDNIKIARKTIDLMNNHDLDSVDQFLARDVRVEATASTGVMDRSQNRVYTQSFINAFPDLQFKVKDVIAQGNKVVVTWIAQGTHQGLLKTPTGDSLPASGRKVTLPGCTVYEFNSSSLINHQEIYWDQGLFMSQLGLMPTQSNRSSSVK